MRNSERVRMALLIGLCVGAATARADETATAEALSPTVEASPVPTAPNGHEGVFGLSGGGGYYTYGVNDVNNGFLDGRNGSFHGGLGYGAALKYGISDRWTGKLGVDYLLASAASSKSVGGVSYNSQVDLPATMIFVGAEYVVLPTPAMDLKLSAGYALVSIFNGKENATNGSNLDLGAISGSASGLQLGAGAELFLSRGFSFEADLAYNFARIDRATFAGAPSDSNSVSRDGVVDYSGLVAKVAFTIFLVP